MKGRSGFTVTSGDGDPVEVDEATKSRDIGEGVESRECRELELEVGTRKDIDSLKETLGFDIMHGLVAGRVVAVASLGDFGPLLSSLRMRPVIPTRSGRRSISFLPCSITRGSLTFSSRTKASCNPKRNRG